MICELRFMKIAPHWVKEKREIAGLLFRLRGYSFRSREEAQQRMEQKAQLHAALHCPEPTLGTEEYRRRLRELDEQAHAGEYDVVITEELLEQVDARNAITRNRYGVDVLNSEDTCFLDVDSFAPGFWERLRSVFGGGRSDEARLLETARALCRADESLGIRLYRTARGWRIIAVAEGLAPTSPRMQWLCEQLRVDGLYCRLCMRQACWRARLTPKPWRLGMPGVYPQPQASDEASAAAEAWLAEYRAKSAGVGVCRLVEVCGAPVKSPIVELHDELTGAKKMDLHLG